MPFEQQIDLDALAEQARKDAPVDLDALAKKAREANAGSYTTYNKAAGIPTVSVPMYNHPIDPATGQRTEKPQVITPKPGIEPLSTVDKMIVGPLSFITSGSWTPQSESTLEAGRRGEAPSFLKQQAGEGLGGTQQLGHGLYGLSHPESPRQMAGAASDVIRGGFTTATPAMLPAMLANIPAAALGLGTFTVAQAGAERLGEKVGMPDEYNRLLGDLVGMYGGAKVHGWLNKLGEIPDQRMANSIYQKLQGAVEALKDPNLSPTERAATKAGVDAMLGSLKQGEQWGMPSFFPNLTGQQPPAGAPAAGVDHVPGPTGGPIRLKGKPLYQYLYLTNVKRVDPQEALKQVLRGTYAGAATGATKPGRLGVRNVLTPEAQSSQEFLDRFGVPTPLSMQTGSKAAGSLEATTQNLPGGGGFHEKMLESQRKLREEVAPGVLAEVSPGEKLTQEEVGSSVQTALEQNLSQRQAELGGLVHPEPVTPEEIGTTLKKTLGTGLERTRTGLAEEVLPGQPMTPGTAGEALLGRGKQEIRKFDQAADESYKAAWEAERNPRNVETVPKFDDKGKPVLDEEGNQLSEKMALPIDMAPVQKALKPLADRYEYTLRETDIRASLGLKAMRQIIDGPRFKPASAAEIDLGMLKDASRTEKGLAELRDPSQGMAAKSVAELQTAIDAKLAKAHYPGWDPGSGTPSPALRHLQSGRKATAQKYEVADLFRPYGQNIETVEGVRLFEQLAGGRDVSVGQLRKMADKFPEQMPHIARAFIENGGNWEGLGPETKKILFKDPGIIEGLDKYYAKQEKFGPLTGLEPVALFNRLTAKGGTRINLLRDVLAEAPEHRAQIGRAFIDSGGNWEALDAETRTALFKDRALIGSLDEYYANQAHFGPLLKLEPVNLFNRITAPGGTRINLAQEILAQTPQHRAQIGRAFVEGLFDTAAREGDFRNVQSTMDKWLKLDDKTKNALIPDPKIRQNMNDLFLSMKRLVANPNPSGSGLIAALTKMKGNIFMGLGGLAGYGGHGVGAGAGGMLAGAAIEYGSNAALAHLLFNQKFINMLNRGIKAELQGDNASGRLAARTLKKIIEENPPEGPQGPPEGSGTPPINPPGGGEGPPPPPAEQTGRGGAGTGKGEPLSIYDSLQKAGDEARERFRKNMGTTMQAGFGFYGGKDVLTTIAADVAKGVKTHGAKINAAVKDMGEWGAGRIYGGYARYPEWKEQMLKDAGELSPEAQDFFSKNAKRIYASAQHTLKQRMSEMGGDAIGDVKKIFEYADAGMDAKEWYDHARPQLQKIFGPHTDLFLNFLAATSPQTKVAPNVEEAMQAFQEHIAGRPFSTNFEAHVKNLGRAARGEPLSGPKVTSFIANLLGDKIRVTVDTWMAQAYGLGIKSKAHLEALAKGEDAKAGLSDPQYRFLDYAVTQAARQRGIDPRQMQAAIWVGIKRMEGNPKYTHEPFGVVVRDYLKANPDVAKLIEGAVANAKAANRKR